jgi:hypothetical protein
VQDKDGGKQLGKCLSFLVGGATEEEKEEEDIIQIIKITQLQCTGHLQRMGNNEIHRRIMD